MRCKYSRKLIRLGFFLMIFVFPNIINILFIEQYKNYNIQTSKLFRSAGQNEQYPFSSSIANINNDNASGYSYRNNLTYQLDYRFKMTNKSPHPGLDDVRLWFSRINNQTFPQQTGKPESFQSIISSNSSNYNIFPSYDYYYDPFDDYNNTFEYFYIKTNDAYDAFEYNISYIITSRETNWKIDKDKIGTYNVSDPKYLNYTGKENMIDTDDSNIQNLVSQLILGKTSLIEKVESIYNWITNKNNMRYAIQNNEKSASQTFIDREGDCSEFSNLMVTMLRIAGIPARKVCGIAIVEVGSENQWVFPEFYKGKTFDYKIRWEYNNLILNTIPGHAWVEYYIPNYGWISCDPTFGFDSKTNFLNRITEIHLPFTLGENFGGGIDPYLNESQTELAVVPFLYGHPNYILFQLDIKITILDFFKYSENYLYILVIILAVITIIAISIYAFKLRKGNQFKF